MQNCQKIPGALARSNSALEAVHSAGWEGAPPAVELVPPPAHHAVKADGMRVVNVSSAAPRCCQRSRTPEAW